MALVRRWYQPHLEHLYDNPGARIGDLDQLEQIAGTYPTRSSFLTELTPDPPEATSGEAVPPHLDEDYLVLSTIHSAKGQECVRAERDLWLHPIGFEIGLTRLPAEAQGWQSLNRAAEIDKSVAAVWREALAALERDSSARLPGG
jgi:hypothetical protein